MTLRDELVSLIRDIRNSRNLEANLERFFGLINAREQEVIAILSIRWLVSVCDTFADHGKELERPNAMLISMFINMLRMAETISFISGPFESERVDEARESRIECFDGVTTFNIDRQDVYLNLCKRMANVMPSTPFLWTVWNEILRRIHACDNVMVRVRNMSAMPERYFPLAPLEMPDNYGVI